MRKTSLTIVAVTVLLGCGKNAVQTQVAESASQPSFSEQLAPAELVHELAAELNSAVPASGGGSTQYQNVNIREHDFTVSLPPEQQQEFVSRIQSTVVARLKALGYEIGPSGSEDEVTSFDVGYGKHPIVGDIRVNSVVDTNHQLRVFICIHEYRK